MAYTRKKWENGEVITDDKLNNLEEGVSEGINTATLAKDAANKALAEVKAKAPTSHASPGTDYGKGDANNHGHVKLSDAVDSESGVDGGVAATPAAVKAAYDLAQNAIGAAGTVPTNHASTATTYGKGDASKYGHVKLSDSVASTLGATGGTAATPSAVKAAYDLADTANSTAGEAKTAADSKAPTNHASTDTTYGKGDASNYGHVKLSASTTSTSGTTSGIAATPSAVKAAYDLADTANTAAGEAKTAAAAAQTTADEKAPESHASTATTYGAGTSSKYGHVKLSASTSSTSGASSGVAATPSAVKAAYDLANGKADPDDIPTKTSQLTNDSGFLTAHQDISGKLDKSGGTMTGVLKAQNNTAYTTKQVRNIFLIAEGASLPSGSNGDICLVYAP